MFSVHLTYDGATLTMTITDATTLAQWTRGFAVDIPGAVGATTAYIGFGAGSGGLTAVQDILTWTYSTSGSSNQRPTATITAPSTDVTINAGQSVSFAGTGTDPDGTIASYAWAFPGGNPGSSSVASVGNVTYSTPGTYVASLTVTDNGGLASSPATRTITVPDFALSATPTSQIVPPGSVTSYTVAVQPGAGFVGNVAFAVSGLPSGAAGTFAPTSVNTSGSTILTVTTSSTTVPGSYPLVITGNTGVLAHTVSVTLIVRADFSISVSPSSRTIQQGGTATYTVTITGGTGFSGTVTLSTTGLPTRASATFNPASVAGSGTSTLTVSTNKNTPKGTRTLTVTGTSGPVVHSATAIVTVQ